MKRRHLVTALGVGAASLGLSACQQPPATDCQPGAGGSKIRWKMLTTWPQNFPGLGTGASQLAKRIQQMSGGRLEIKLYAAGELVPPLETFDAVSRGIAEMGHASPYYWKSTHEAAQFFTAVPFGLTAQEMNAWLYYGGGLELWHQLYARYNLIAFPAGNTGVQMAGWFNQPVNSLEDLKGLKMRIPGLGGEVLRRAGGLPQLLPGNEIFTALQTGAIDATEWVGPYNDLAFGLYKAAKYYYYPGWQEPGANMECLINKEAFNSLPEDLQWIVRQACQAENLDMLANYTAENNKALNILINQHQVQVKRLPEEVLTRLSQLADEVCAEIAARDPFSQTVYDSFIAFRDSVYDWTAVSDQPIINGR